MAPPGRPDELQQTQQALKLAVEEEALAYEELQRAEEAFRLQLARIPTPAPSNKVQALRQTLEAVRRRCDVLDRSMSFELFERWRRRLDWELQAGGQVEDANSVKLPAAEASAGWAPAAELAAKSAAASKAAQRKRGLEGQLMEAQRSLLRLRSRYHGLPQEMQELYQQLAEERRQTNEWWEWHTARLPQYHEDLTKLRQMEAWSSAMRQKMEECSNQLASHRREEELAEAELASARESLQSNEMQVERFLSLLEECEVQERELKKQANLEPHKVDRLRRVQHYGERLQEAQALRRSLEMAQEEAKKTDAQAQEGRKGVHTRIMRASEELRDADRHLQFLVDLRAQEAARLGEVEREKRQLLEAHRKGAVEHERLKCQLHALSSGDVLELPKSQESSQHLSQGPCYQLPAEVVQQSFAPRRPL